MSTTITTQQPLTVELTQEQAETVIYTVASRIAADAEELEGLYPPDTPGQIFEVVAHAARTARLASVLEQLHPTSVREPRFTATGRTMLEVMAALERDAAEAETHPGELSELPYADTLRTVAGAIA